jgi:hypothetical protein
MYTCIHVMEKVYQTFLEKHLCGSHCKCEYGETDVSTETIHAEIKHIKSWKSAFKI